MKNKYRLVALMLLSILVLQVAPYSSFACPPKDDAQIAKEIFVLVNTYRQKKGLTPLKYSDAAAAEAQTHSNRMAKRLVPFGHAGFDGRFNRLKRKLPRMMGCAENVAYGAATAQAAVDMWLHSPGHKKNIKGKYTHTGIGVSRNRKGVLYFTQVFIRIQ